MTQNFLHKSHLEIFGFFAPPALKNSFNDDFVTHVYGKENTFMLPKHVIKNSNMLGTRVKLEGESGGRESGSGWKTHWTMMQYAGCDAKILGQIYETELNKGKSKIEAWLRNSGK
eukprot:TRINITY_DN4492_c0_g1_i9.p1 TRINITY_DN4492_c0_g1~~TRINITY_DN4492_c0_g1_i9.p1  ORF type:complete len:115 (+),score=20.65 TRINITY_DN4492_c0_g1_i9:255-599(+)